MTLRTLDYVHMQVGDQLVDVVDSTRDTAIDPFLFWAELIEPRVHDNLCGDCIRPLRRLTRPEAAVAESWFREPFAVCTGCHAIHTRPRPHQRDRHTARYRLVTGLSWRRPDPANPFGLPT